MQYLPFSVPVGASFPLRVKANYCRYYKNTAGAANPTVRIRTDKGDDVLLSLNEAAHFPRTWENATLENYDGVATIAGVLLIGEGQVDVSTFSGSVAITALPGLVADNADAQAPVGAGGILPVVARLQAFSTGGAYDRLKSFTNDADGVANYGGLLGAETFTHAFNGATWDRLRADNEGAGVGALRVAQFADAISAAGGAYIGFASLGAVVGQVAEVQVWNPVGSGKTVRVDCFTPQPSASEVYGIQRSAGQLANLGTVFKKNNGGAASSAQLRYQTVAAPSGTRVMSVSHNNGVRITFTPPFYLNPGEGVHLTGLTANTGLDCAVEFREV